MSFSGEEASAGDSLELIEEGRKLQELRQALLADCRECCKSYIVAEDEKLLRILRIKSFSVQKAVEAIERHENFKLKYPEVYLLPFEKYSKCYENGMFGLLREKDVKGRRVALLTAKYWHTSEVSLEALTKAATYLAEELVMTKEVQMDGMVLIIDYKDVGYKQLAKHVASISFHEARRGNDFIKGGTIVKMKGIYILHAPFAIVQLMKMIKLMLSKKIRKRIHFCDPESEEFTSNFRKEQLPKSLNGALREEDALDLDFCARCLVKERNRSFEETF